MTGSRPAVSWAQRACCHGAGWGGLGWHSSLGAPTKGSGASVPRDGAGGASGDPCTQSQGLPCSRENNIPYVQIVNSAMVDMKKSISNL